MKKNVIKEIIIMLLLTLAIILVLGVLLYEYVPANKIIPKKVSYTTPEEVKRELETVTDENDDEQYFDYHIDATQIKNYQKIQEYVPGRKNPFGELESEKTTATTTEQNQNSGNNSNKVENSNKESNAVKENTSSTANTPNRQDNSSTSTSSTAGSTTSSTTQESAGYLPDKGTK